MLCCKLKTLRRQKHRRDRRSSADMFGLNRCIGIKVSIVSARGGVFGHVGEGANTAILWKLTESILNTVET